MLGLSPLSTCTIIGVTVFLSFVIVTIIIIRSTLKQNLEHATSSKKDAFIVWLLSMSVSSLMSIIILHVFSMSIFLHSIPEPIGFIKTYNNEYYAIGKNRSGEMDVSKVDIEKESLDNFKEHECIFVSADVKDDQVTFIGYDNDYFDNDRLIHIIRNTKDFMESACPDQINYYDMLTAYVNFYEDIFIVFIDDSSGYESNKCVVYVNDHAILTDNIQSISSIFTVDE